MGQTRGIRNNNPLNIRKGSRWQGMNCPQTDKEFCRFETMEYGVRAALKLIVNYIAGHNCSRVRFNTIYRIISRWAPPSENNTQTYIDFVSSKSGIHQFEVIKSTDKDSIYRIMEAMALMESKYSLSRETFDNAWSLL